MVLQKGIPETGIHLLSYSLCWASGFLGSCLIRESAQTIVLSHLRHTPPTLPFGAPLSNPDMRLSPLQFTGRSKLQDNLREGPYRCHQILTLAFVVYIWIHLQERRNTGGQNLTHTWNLINRIN